MRSCLSSRSIRQILVHIVMMPFIKNSTPHTKKHVASGKTCTKIAQSSHEDLHQAGLESVREQLRRPRNDLADFLLRPHALSVPQPKPMEHRAASFTRNTQIRRLVIRCSFLNLFPPTAKSRSSTLGAEKKLWGSTVRAGRNGRPLYSIQFHLSSIQRNSRFKQK